VILGIGFIILFIVLRVLYIYKCTYFRFVCKLVEKEILTSRTNVFHCYTFEYTVIAPDSETSSPLGSLDRGKGIKPIRKGGPVKKEQLVKPIPGNTFC